VLLSLLWNVMAWAVGVFIAYMAHDKDPDFMDATRQYQSAHLRYTRRRKPFVNRVRQIGARLTKEIERLEAGARARSADTMAERDLYNQVEAHESALVNAVAAATRNNANVYRANLAQLAAAQRGTVTIERTGASPGEMTLADFRNLEPNITAETIRNLVR
jgi:hypothetical protein